MIENILLVLLVLLLSAKIIGSLFERIGLDATLGELLTGVIFGPSILNLIHAESIESFAIIGSIFILFIAGIKQQNAREIYKDRPAIEIGLTLLIVTSIVMGFFFYFIPPYFGINLSVLQAVVLGLAFAIIDVGVPAKVLLSKGLMRLPVGRITIRSSIINIIIGLCLFTAITLIISGNATEIMMNLGGILLFISLTAGSIYLLSKIAKFVVKIHVEEAEFSLAIVLVLALAYFTEVLGFSNILGAFIGGVLIAQLPFAETKSFSDKIKSISFGLFVPLFFVWFGLEIHLAEIWKHIILAVLIFLAYASLRFLITYLFIKKHKLGTPGLVSSSMLSVDIESLVVLMIAIRLGIFITNIPLTLFAPSVFFSTFFIVVLVAIFSKIEKGIKKKRKLHEVSKEARTVVS
jgi:Kef-type K+ transport system membrane component KefB